MDISVSHLNNRLSLQLPQELPLGLVFVTGTISFSDSTAFTELVAHGRYKHIHFDLLDSRHRIRCVLVVRAMVDYDLEIGARVRVGGHLRFDPQRADYYLLARDLERLDENVFADVTSDVADQEEIAALLSDIRKRTNKQTVPADMPNWVQELAPDSIKQEIAESEADDADTAVSEQADIQSEAELVSSISALLDQPEDVVLTPDMIPAEYEERPEPPQQMIEEESELDSDEDIPEAVEESQPSDLIRTQTIPQSNDQDWLVWLLVGIIFVLIVVVLWNMFT